MTLALLTIGEHLSLEFDPSDLDAVRAYIDAQYPDHNARAAGIATIASLGGEELIYQNEWDDPCLISSSIEGDALLRGIYGALFRG